MAFAVGPAATSEAASGVDRGYRGGGQGIGIQLTRLVRSLVPLCVRRRHRYSRSPAARGLAPILNSSLRTSLPSRATLRSRSRLGRRGPSRFRRSRGRTRAHFLKRIGQLTTRPVLRRCSSWVSVCRATAPHRPKISTRAPGSRDGCDPRSRAGRLPARRPVVAWRERPSDNRIHEQQPHRPERRGGDLQ
jgi:hypothetical protein